MTKRQQIVDAIETALKGVTAFGGRVYPWLRVDLPVTSLPALAVYDRSATHDYIAQGAFDHELEVTVEVLAAGKTSAAQVRNHMGDVHAAIVSDRSLGGISGNIELTASSLEMIQEGDVVAAAVMTYTVQYRTSPDTL